MNSVDRIVGHRIRERRRSLGMSQTALAERIGVRFQQVQKYENGQNRVAASRLIKIAEALGVPLAFFFEGGEDDGGGGGGCQPVDRRAREVVDLFHRLSDPQKQAVLAFLRSIASENADFQTTSLR